MQGHDTVGWLGFATMLFMWAFVSYPAWCAITLRDRVAPAHSWLQRVSVTLTIIASVMVVPASLLDMGWVIIPAAIFLLAIDYGSTEKILVELNEREGTVQGVASFLALFAPLLVLCVLVAVAVGSEYSMALQDDASAIGMMRELALTSFTILGIVPLTVSVVFVLLSYVRHRRKASRAA